MNRKKRAYMRGIGVGMFVTALILIIARINSKAEISDAEIISRAHELGMIESDSLSLSTATENPDALNQDQGSGSNLYPVLVPTGNNDEGSGQDAGASSVNTDVQTDPGVTDDPGTQADTDAQDDPNAQAEDPADAQPDSDVQTDPDVQADDPDAAQPDVPAEPDTQPASTDYVVLTVERGNSSNVVADKLQRLGVIENAKDFDNYLVNNGYANRISVGTFQIPVGSSYEWIAGKITNSL